ncbi:SRPBCC family protein [Streptomyces sp. HUAS MG47]|uniref:SRPBCC family protein n=1 Tax=Streptomyces solicamelliae TaxID=3231716 RepID=UPI00387828FF
MADTKGSGRGATGTKDADRTSDGSRTQKLLDQNPGANRLAEEFQSYVQARLDKALTGVGHRVGDVAAKVGAAHIGPREALHGAKAVAVHAKDAVMDKITSDSSDEPRSSAANAGDKSLTVIEDIDVGVPVEQAYNQWTQFQEFSRFAKGVVSVDQENETTTQWQVKVAKSSRAWKGTITEQVPDERIAWTSEGAKGTTRGVVTFHPLGENLTKVLLVMEYYPKGIVEKTGALVRAQGRRARLDLKAFRTFVMMQGEATGSWRGEIRDGEVVAGPDEDEDEEQDEDADETEYDDREREDAEDDAEDAYESGEEPEDAYEDEARETDEYDEEPEEPEEEEDEDRYEDDEDDVDEEADAEAEDQPRARRSRKS